MEDFRIAAILNRTRGLRDQPEETVSAEMIEQDFQVTDSGARTSTPEESVSRSMNRSPTPIQTGTPSKFKQPQLKRGRVLDRILVHPSQIHGNPLLEELKKVPNLRYSVSNDIDADYITGYTTSLLFLSLKYHGLHPDYIETRMGKVGQSHDLKILLVVVDVDNSTNGLKDLTRMTVNRDFTIILAGNMREASDYIASLHKLQTSPPNIIQKIPKVTYKEQLIDVSTRVPNVSSSNMFVIGAKYGSIKRAIEKSSTEDIYQLPGWGERKAEGFRRAFNEPFYW